MSDVEDLRYLCTATDTANPISKRLHALSSVINTPGYIILLHVLLTVPTVTAAGKPPVKVTTAKSSGKWLRWQVHFYDTCTAGYNTHQGSQLLPVLILGCTAV